MNVFVCLVFGVAIMGLILGLPIFSFLGMLFGMYLLFSESLPIPLLKVVARLSKGYVVALKDSSGETKVSIATINASGDMGAYFFWKTSTNFCLLNDEGVVGGGNYVKKWRYVDSQSAPDYTKGWKKDGTK